MSDREDIIILMAEAIMDVSIHDGSQERARKGISHYRTMIWGTRENSPEHCRYRIFWPPGFSPVPAHVDFALH